MTTLTHSRMQHCYLHARHVGEMVFSFGDPGSGDAFVNLYGMALVPLEDIATGAPNREETLQRLTQAADTILAEIKLPSPSGQ